MLSRKTWLFAGNSVTSHSGRAATPRSCVLDEQGRLYLDTDLGFGLIHTLDMEQAADAVEQQVWQPQQVDSDELPARFAFVRSPHRLPAQQ